MRKSSASCWPLTPSELPRLKQAIKHGMNDLESRRTKRSPASKSNERRIWLKSKRIESLRLRNIKLRFNCCSQKSKPFTSSWRLLSRNRKEQHNWLRPRRFPAMNSTNANVKRLRRSSDLKKPRCCWTSIRTRQRVYEEAGCVLTHQ